MRRALIWAFVAVALGSTGLAAQDTPPPTPPPAEPPTQLVFEREVFNYPSFDRRNPFSPLSSNSAGGPRFEQIQLRTIIYSSNPDLSLAVFSTGGGASLEALAEGTAELSVEDMVTQRLRRGQVWGNMRVAEIQRDRVIVVVEEFGRSETHEMMIPRAGQGGS